MKRIPCRYCGRPSEDGSGVCDRCERTYEKPRRLTFRAKRGHRRAKGEKYGDQNGWIPARTADEDLPMKTENHQTLKELCDAGTAARDAIASHGHGDHQPTLEAFLRLNAILPKATAVLAALEPRNPSAEQIIR